jgi:hypothetical protein
MPSWFIFVLIGLVGGVTAGIFGIGGGIIIVPALVYWAGFSQHMATGTTLAVLLPPIGLAAVRSARRWSKWSSRHLSKLASPSNWKRSRIWRRLWATVQWELRASSLTGRLSTQAACLTRRRSLPGFRKPKLGTPYPHRQRFSCPSPD